MFVTGCAPKSTINKDIIGVVPDAPETIAQVGFVRPPAFVGGGAKISIYDVLNDDDILLGVLTFKTYTIANLKPGKHTFWAHFSGSRCSYLNADLKGGKTYYILARTWMGAIRGGLELRPINQTESNDLIEWMGKCRHTSIDEKSRKWADKNLPDLHKWCAGDFEKHKAKGEHLDLLPEQGLTSPVRMGKKLPKTSK